MIMYFRGSWPILSPRGWVMTGLIHQDDLIPLTLTGLHRADDTTLANDIWGIHWGSLGKVSSLLKRAAGRHLTISMNLRQFWWRERSYGHFHYLLLTGSIFLLGLSGNYLLFSEQNSKRGFIVFIHRWGNSDLIAVKSCHLGGSVG